MFLKSDKAKQKVKQRKTAESDIKAQLKLRPPAHLLALGDHIPKMDEITPCSESAKDADIEQ